MATLLLEVGTEELPVDFLLSAPQQWRSRLPKVLEEQLLPYEALTVYSTPRRLAVVISGLPACQLDQELEVKGPPAQAAFRDGQPTKAAVGFARSRGVAVADLEVRATDKGDFVFVRQHLPGRATAEILVELIPHWITGLTGKRLMRWGDGELRFPRPIRWLVALLDEMVLPVTLENGSITIRSDRHSQGHRIPPLGSKMSIEFDRADDYASSLRRAGVDVDPVRRQAAIAQQVEAAAQAVGGRADLAPALLEEVTQLVEWPVAITGKFDPAFLSLPPEVITTVMMTHQRYFPVLSGTGDQPCQLEPRSLAPKQASELRDSKLLPYFIAVVNGNHAHRAEGSQNLIVAGNERVLRARLADGEYFYRVDSEQPLASYVPALKQVTFQEQLGSVYGKMERLSRIADAIGEQLAIPVPEQTIIRRAAYLCKADLVTQMVYEFPELQGVIGEKYAQISGEDPAVARAIAEHYLPRGAGDQLAQTQAGQIVGLADRLDTLVSIFGLGLLPSGSSDPFGLRRAANAVINTIWAADLPLNLDKLLAKATQDFIDQFQWNDSSTVPVGDSGSRSFQPQATPNLLSSLQEFFGQRLQTLLKEERGIDYDLVQGILGEGDAHYQQRALGDLLDLRDRADYLQTIRRNQTLAAIYPTVNRATRLAAQGTLGQDILEPQGVVQPALFQSEVEQAFYDALVRLLPQTEAAQRDYPGLVAAMADIAPTVDRFFDGPDSVLVMDPNPAIRENRLNLLGLLRNHSRVLADFGAILKP